MISQTQPLFSKLQHRSVHDIYINISHFIDHFIMLIFAKAAYDAGRFFGMGNYDNNSNRTRGFVLFGAVAPIAARLADRYSRSLLMVVFHFGVGASAIIAGFASLSSSLCAGWH